MNIIGLKRFKTIETYKMLIICWKTCRSSLVKRNIFATWLQFILSCGYDLVWE